ncbi:hypothetical protein [Ruminococcus sp.]|uniref:hypothetical protein n=1 Tax=Ruminococcus sp. TaxID=41978 RepID=UPI002E808178|nr:hypothetical protein [Ruminococcus sp.]MEE3492712.1 hypothetical protein [Ruminococcus sp.]
MKKKTLIIILSVVLGVILIALSIPGMKYIKNLFTADTYDAKYAVEWVSDDKHITFVADSITGIQGRGVYQGKYVDNNGYEYEIKVIREVGLTIRTKDELIVLSGIGHMNYFADTLTVNVEKVDADISIYKPGDTIVFKKRK